ncbi:MAG: nucleotide sugar dehydrogenase [Firmicutes bacterium]|nr:nucleotide sugar dehydrogenase [Bacillota bacterium]
MKICVIGLGYIGLPTSAMFAAHGHNVLGVDKNPAVIEALNQGSIIIEEANLDSFVKDVVEKGTLRGAMEPEEADAFIIAVPTPITEEKKADMRYVQAATEMILPYIRKGNLVILESTSPVGTVEQLMLPILEKSGLKMGEELFVGHSPERVIPGQILYELVHNSRIAGGINAISAQKIAELYRSFVEGEIYQCDARTAELCKLTENTFRDINIAFANELAQICENLDIDVWQVIQLCNKHPRVNIHQPGPGVGGHCIAVDPWFIIEKQPDTAKLIHQARLINDYMPEYVAAHIYELLEDVEQPQVTILGLTYKPDVDDIRESPVLKLAALLEKNGVAVKRHDPFVKAYQGDVAEACAGSHLVLLGVHHQQYKALPAKEMLAAMAGKLFYDTRNFADEPSLTEAGFEVYSLGR